MESAAVNCDRRRQEWRESRDLLKRNGTWRPSTARTVVSTHVDYMPGDVFTRLQSVRGTMLGPTTVLQAHARAGAAAPRAALAVVGHYRYGSVRARCSSKEREGSSCAMFKLGRGNDAAQRKYVSRDYHATSTPRQDRGPCRM